jgi:tetratricopeptide (TPR) repeat protein
MKISNLLFRLVKKTATILAALGCFSSLFSEGQPGEYMSTARWRDLFSRYSPATNPALLTEINYLDVKACAGLPLQAAYQLGEIGLTIPVGLYESWAISWFPQFSGEVDEIYYAENNSGEQVTGDQIAIKDGIPPRKVSDQKHLFMGSYANNIWGGLSIGANLALAMSTNYGDPVFSLSGDLGLTYRVITHPLLGEHLVGVSLQNILQPILDNLNLPSNFSVPSYTNNIKFSWLGYFLEKQIDAGLDINMKNIYSSLVHSTFTTKTDSGMGIDYKNNIEYDYNLRLGTWLFRMLNVYFLMGNIRQDNEYYGFAVGVNVPHLNDGRDFQFLYQFIGMPMGDQVSSHSFYFRADVGLHREEAYAKRMARVLDMAPNELYNKALKLFYEEKHWDAFFIFSQIIVQFPGFFKNDWVEYYRGACLEKLDMRDLASQNYREAKQDYPKSSVLPYVDLGLMRIAYRENNSAAVSSQYSLLNSENVIDSLKCHAYYLMAEQNMRDKNFQPAIQLFSKIPETHPEYPFAQHSLAIAQVLTYNMEEALNALGNGIEAKVQTEEQREIVNRSYLFLGYIFYEQLALSKAVTALRMVPKQSYYNEDALLGLCWSALRARQWNDCISNGQTLQKTSAKPSLQCEGSLIEAYAHLMQKNYSQCLTVLTAASAKAQTLKAPAPDTLETEQVKYMVNRKEYEVLAFDVNKNSLELPSSTVLHQTDSLHKNQLGTKDKLDKFEKFSNEFYRMSFFSRNIADIKSDIDYALAIVQKISQQTDKTQTQQKMDAKQKELDDEILKLKKQMENLPEKK